MDHYNGVGAGEGGHWEPGHIYIYIKKMPEVCFLSSLATCIMISDAGLRLGWPWKDIGLNGRLTKGARRFLEFRSWFW